MLESTCWICCSVILSSHSNLHILPSIEAKGLNTKMFSHSYSHLVARTFRIMFLVSFIFVVIKVWAVVILGFFVVDERGIVAAAELHLDLRRDGRRSTVSSGRSNRTWTRTTSDRSVRSAAVQSPSFASGRVSGKCFRQCFRCQFLWRPINVPQSELRLYDMTTLPTETDVGANYELKMMWKLNDLNYISLSNILKW